MGELLKAGHEEGAGNMLATGIRVVAERGLDIGVFVHSRSFVCFLEATTSV